MKNSPTAQYAQANIAPLFDQESNSVAMQGAAEFREMNRHDRRAESSAQRHADLRQTARDIRRQTGLTIRESVQLAAEKHDPFPRGIAYWRKNPYDKDSEDYPLARHFIPGTPWRGGNRWQH